MTHIKDLVNTECRFHDEGTTGVLQTAVYPLLDYCQLWNFFQTLHKFPFILSTAPNSAVHLHRHPFVRRTHSRAGNLSYWRRLGFFSFQSRRAHAL